MPRPKILLVDDNKLFLEMEKNFLGDLAVTIYTATNGGEALDLLKTTRPDLIFLDLHMPVMDGAACCEAIKADPDLRSLPVVMVSNADRESDLERCRAAGCDGILTKPINKRILLDFGRKFLPAIDRIELRVPCRTQVVFRVGPGCHYGMSEDISTHGIFIAFKGDIRVDDRVPLSFLLPGADGVLVEAVGRVAWLNRGRPLPKPSLSEGFGVNFLEVDGGSREQIERYMKATAGQASRPRVEGAYTKNGF